MGADGKPLYLSLPERPEDPVKTREEKALIFSTEWSSRPSVPGQLERFPETVRLKSVEYRVLDMSKLDDAALLGELDKETRSGNGGRVLVSREYMQVPDKCTWMALVQYEVYEFKKVDLGNPKPEQENTGNEL